MDLALARRSGQELRKSYTITGSPEFAPLRKYFRAAIHQLWILYTGVPDTLRPQIAMLSLRDRIRTDIDTHTNEVTTVRLPLRLTVHNTAIHRPSRPLHRLWIILRRRQLQLMPSCGRLRQPIGASDFWNPVRSGPHRSALYRLERRCQSRALYN